METGQDLGLRIQDLNLIIKHFSYCIQDRIEELDGTRNSLYRKACLEDNDLEAVLQRYSSYRIEKIKEIRYIQKFCQRILEIFTFFKGKSRMSNQLTLLQDRLVSELDAILTQHPISVPCVFELVVAIMKKPLLNHRKRLIAEMLVNINQAAPPPLVPNYQPARRNGSAVVATKLNSSESNAQLHNPSIPRQLRHPPSSSYSRKEKQPKKFRPSESQTFRLYQPLLLDKTYIQRCCNNLSVLQKDAEDKLFKDMLKKNERIAQQIQIYAKKLLKAQQPSSQQHIKSCSVQTEASQQPRKSFDVNINFERQAPVPDGPKTRAPLQASPLNANGLQFCTQQFKKQGSNITTSQYSHNSRKLSSCRKPQQGDTIYNNWAIKQSSKKKQSTVFDEVTISAFGAQKSATSTLAANEPAPEPESSSYNFCIKQSNKIQHRKFARRSQETPVQPLPDNQENSCLVTTAPTTHKILNDMSRRNRSARHSQLVCENQGAFQTATKLVRMLL